MEALSEWVKNIFIIIIAVCFFETVLPETDIAKYVRFIFSLVILGAILHPLMNLL